MRYQDIENAFEDPMSFNITSETPVVVGTHAQESKVYLSVNDQRRVSVDSDLEGYFEHTFEGISVGDLVKFESRIGSKYVEFWKEKIRE